VPRNKQPLLLGFAAWSGTGKTSLLEKVLPQLREAGVSVAVIKHSHHDFEIDKPGKDSYRLRQAGAVETLIASPHRWALVHENREPQEPVLADLVRHIDPGTELVLVEGFRHESFAKIELHREALNKPWLYPEDDSIIAIACDNPDNTGSLLPVLDINQPRQVSGFILDYLRSRT
jgi:molybdopterin-guanine dinucleotide biosynthesis protein B